MMRVSETPHLQVFLPQTPTDTAAGSALHSGAFPSFSTKQPSRTVPAVEDVFGLAASLTPAIAKAIPGTVWEELTRAVDLGARTSLEVPENTTP